MRAVVITSVQRRAESQKLAVLLLTPPVGTFGILEFSSFDEIVKSSYQHSLQQIAEWNERDQYTTGTAKP